MRTLAQARPVRLAVAVQRRASGDDVGTMAAALTYQAFLSLFPMMLLGVAAIGFVLAGDPATAREWSDRVSGSVPGLAPLVRGNLDLFVDTRVAAGLIGAAGLVWRGASLSKAASHMLARIFRTPEGGLVRRTLMGLARVAILGTLGLGSVVLTSLATSLGGPLPLRVLEVAVAAGVDVVFFAATYTVLTPRGGPSARGHLPGAVAMAVGWTILKLVGNWYVVMVVANTRAAYGAVGTVFGLFAVLALGSQLFLYGAELTAVLRVDTGAQAP